ncbi:MAG TPA: TolC family protein [Ferruginibacter sp.]|jgi:outer membrane protein|nr:TolC family protein [Ferruginibacter sp.]
MRHNIIRIAAYTIVTALLGIHHLQAQDTTKLTLQHAIELGIKNSKQLKGSQARTAEADALLKEAKDRQLPDASISGAYLYLPFQPNITLKTGAPDTSGHGSGIPSISQVMYGMANASLPIFAGGKLRYGVESAKYLAQATKLNGENDKQEVVINTINAFANLYKSKKAVDIVKDNLTQSQQRVTDFTNLEKNGLVARNDLLKVSLQSSNIELSLLDAESNYKLATVNMDLMLGLADTTLLDPDSSSLVQTDTVKTIGAYEQSALQSRKEIASLALQKKAADLGVKSAKADYYPTLAITGGYVAAYIPNFLTVTNAVDFGVGLKYNLSSLWKTKATVHEAQAKALELDANEEMLNDDIRLQINQAYEAYLLSQKRIEVLANAVEQATENYRITKNKYDNALETTTDLLDADVASLQAQLNYTNAKADAVVAYDKLLQTAGLLNN